MFEKQGTRDNRRQDGGTALPGQAAKETGWERRKGARASGGGVQSGGECKLGRRAGEPGS